MGEKGEGEAENKKGGGQRVRALSRSGGRGVPALIPESEIGRQPGCRLEPEQGHLTHELYGLGSAIYILDASVHSFVLWFICSLVNSFIHLTE